MGVLDDFKDATVGLDTAPLIYFIEKNPTHHPRVRPFFTALDAGQFSAITTTITLVETLVHPLRNNHHELAKRYRELLLRSAHLTMYEVSPDIAQKAAEIRAKYQIRTPDAIQLVAALQGRATFS